MADQAAELLVEFVADQFDDGTRSDEYWAWLAGEIKSRLSTPIAPVQDDDAEELAALKHDYDRLAERENYYVNLSEGLRSALERLDRNFDLLLRGKPVRDVAETKAEVRHALAAVSQGKLEVEG